MAGFTNLPGTNLGPLTTSWSMPATCSLYMPDCSTCSVGFAAQSCNAANGGSPRDNTACWPPASAGVSSPAWPFVGWGFYSPGLACPTGYVSACTAVYGQRPDWDIEFKLFQGETAIGCCPKNFKCTNINGNTCIATITTSQPVPTAYCKGTAVTEVTTAVFPDVITVTSSASKRAMATSTATRTMQLMAPMFQLNFQASDLASSKSTKTTSKSKTSSKTSLKTTPTSSNSGPSKITPNGKKKKGLTTGAKAGIGIGVAAGVLGLIGSAAAFFVRKGKGEKTEAGAGDQTDEAKREFLPAHELQEFPIAELPAPVSKGDDRVLSQV